MRTTWIILAVVIVLLLAALAWGWSHSADKPNHFACVPPPPSGMGCV
jgi:hypothetical protein